jgi:hypothetical protein
MSNDRKPDMYFGWTRRPIYRDECSDDMWQWYVETEKSFDRLGADNARVDLVVYSVVLTLIIVLSVNEYEMIFYISLGCLVVIWGVVAWIWFTLPGGQKIWQWIKNNSRMPSEI